MSDVSLHTHQTRVGTPIRAVQDQYHRYELSPTHGHLPPNSQQPRYHGVHDKARHQTGRCAGRRYEFWVEQSGHGREMNALVHLVIYELYV